MPGEWWTKSWGVVEGCTPVSRGCDNCWARSMLKRFGQNPHEVRTFPERLDQPLKWKRPKGWVRAKDGGWTEDRHRVFVAPRGDLFHKDVPDEFIEQVFMTMTDAKWHTFLVLTKHGATGPKPRLLEWDRWAYKCIPAGDRGHRVKPYFASNIWLGVSVENQATADERVPILLQTPAAHRWVSAEPLLGPLDLERFLWGIVPDTASYYDNGRLRTRGAGGQTIGRAPRNIIHHLVTAPESGPGRRYCDLDWVKGIVGQCKAAHVPVMVKHLFLDGKRVSLPLLDGVRYDACP